MHLLCALFLAHFDLEMLVESYFKKFFFYRNCVILNANLWYTLLQIELRNKIYDSFVADYSTIVKKKKKKK